MTRVGRWANIAAHVTAVLNGGKPCAGGCGWPVDPAAAAGPDGTPNTYDRHPGCEPGGAQLRLIPGGKTNRTT
ncbi:hypothetical protein [Micromonospora cathayae]|uniref:Uncharacterized protein n=1 Tax=Micromonospora cathayae TaxID=3028804 RepID=A0ABY7ZVX4_9ACTN|nr:hypothetical protein [Micromonospora sp. HUAS 3]WDZ87217.1 hypothetical protein PVK37_12815 [Micromonospora sp. HUAS 3]